MSLTYEVRSATNGAARRSVASRIRIVVVDDHPITLAGLNVLLGADFTVLARCGDAHEAWRAVRIYEPDLLIIDQDMPAMAASMCSSSCAQPVIRHRSYCSRRRTMRS